MTKMRITEIFYSLQGESTRVGLPTVFVRLTGCPLRCQYCDTTYAFKGGGWQSFEDIYKQIEAYKTSYVCITGGEPLAQPSVLPLMTQLCDQGYEVSIETSGALDISNVDPPVMLVMDIKTPDSREVDQNLFENIKHLKSTDQIKFVICSRTDYTWAKKIIEEKDLKNHCEILFSPSYNDLDAAILANWIVEDKLPVRFQHQLHKQLWGETAGK